MALRDSKNLRTEEFMALWM